jgi:hypothetical protein
MFVARSKPFNIKPAGDLPSLSYTMFTFDKNVLSGLATPPKNKGAPGDVAHDGLQGRYWIRMEAGWVEAKLGACHPFRAGYALGWRPKKEQLVWETKAAASHAQRQAEQRNEGMY